MISILIPEISQGGAQIQAIRSANALAKKKDSKVKFIVIKRVKDKNKYLLDLLEKNIKIIKINKKIGKYHNLKAILILNRNISKGEIIIAFLWYAQLISVVCKTLFFWKKIKIIGMIRREYPKSYERNFLNKLIHKKLDLVTTNCKKDSYLKRLLKLNENSFKINNIMPVYNFKRKTELKNRYNIIYPARYVESKNHILLFKIMSKISEKNLPIICNCFGDKTDPYYKKIKIIFEKMGGFQKLKVNLNSNYKFEEIQKIYSNADSLLFTSFSEGESNVMLEAILFGLRIFCFKKSDNFDKGQFIKFFEDINEAVDFLLCDFYNLTGLSEDEENSRNLFIKDNYGEENFSKNIFKLIKKI